MRAISLWQPWASLVAIGAKRFETRHWPTSHRGWLLIHAAKTQVTGYISSGAREAMHRVLGVQNFKTLPHGMVVAVAYLARCDSTRLIQPDGDERWFGDYGPNRYAWRLDQIQPLAEPISVKGFQGLWIPSPELVTEVQRQVRLVREGSLFA